MKQKKCVYCDTLYPIETEHCPLCGGSYADIIETDEPQKAEPAPAPKAPVAPVAPVRPKRQKPEPVIEEEIEDNEEEDGNPTPRWMTALISVVLALALVVGLAFIGYSLGFFDGKDDPEDQVSLPLDDKTPQLPDESDPIPDENLNVNPGVNDNQQPDVNPDENQPPVDDPDVNQDPVDDPTVNPDDQDPPVDPDEQDPPVDPDDDPDEPDEPVVPQYPCTSISLNYTDVTLFSKGESFTIKATLNPSNCDEEIVWTSSDEAYATVNQNGKVTAVNGKNNGSVKIIATCGSERAECIVRLAFAESESGSSAETDTQAGGYSLSITDFTMMFNGEQVEVEVKNANLMTDTFVWTIDNPEIASIVVAKDTCIVTALTSGTTNLHVTINDTVKLSCIVRCSKAVGGGAESGAENGAETGQ
ncbi:MAG: Ig-like domain-containing protein [Ruminococcaceae bacterium]|nr:Ig-like domain-containing protein [Oscillospiraceae bacterium]